MTRIEEIEARTVNARGTAECLRKYAARWDSLHFDVAQDFRCGAKAIEDREHLLAEVKRMREALEKDATAFDNLAVILENWANESRNGGWSTHQVSANRQQAEYCRVDAASIRAALKSKE